MTNNIINNSCNSYTSNCNENCKSYPISYINTLGRKADAFDKIYSILREKISLISSSSDIYKSTKNGCIKVGTITGDTHYSLAPLSEKETITVLNAFLSGWGSNYRIKVPDSINPSSEPHSCV